jgi:hypothetical protein
MPPGAVTVAVFVIVPLPVAVALTVNVAVPPLSRFTDAAMLPVPVAGQVEPALAEHVQPLTVMFAGKTSATVAPVTALGPAFDTTIVYVSVPFWFTDVTPSVFVMPRFAVGVMTVFASVALLLPAGSLMPPGAVTVAVLLIVPLPVAVAVTVNVAVPPLSRLTLAEMLPVPVAGQVEPALAEQVQPLTVMFAGKTSATVAPVTALGPAFDTTIVYVTAPP